MNEKKILAISASIFMVLVGLSVAYYFVLYIPQRDNAKQMQQLETEKVKSQAEQEANIIRERKYEACLSDAETNFRGAWISKCEANSIEITKDEDGLDNCLMPSAMSDSLREQYNRTKDTCLEIYKTR